MTEFQLWVLPTIFFGSYKIVERKILEGVLRERVTILKPCKFPVLFWNQLRINIEIVYIPNVLKNNTSTLIREPTSTCSSGVAIACTSVLQQRVMKNIGCIFKNSPVKG